MSDGFDRVRDVPDPDAPNGDKWYLNDTSEASAAAVESAGFDPSEWGDGRTFERREGGETTALVWFPGMVAYLHNPLTALVDPETGEPVESPDRKLY